MDSNLVNALKRLERAGSEHSRATDKLCKAVTVVARAVADSVDLPARTMLPRDYQVISYYGSHDSWVGDGINLISDHSIDDFGEARVESHKVCDYDALPVCSRATALHFARDVAEGWLDEVATWVETRNAEAEAATVVLESAHPQLT